MSTAFTRASPFCPHVRAECNRLLGMECCDADERIDAFQYMTAMLSRSEAFKKLHDYFQALGFNLILARAKVYVYVVSATTGGSSVISPNIIGILPSLVPAKPTDPYHEAVGISVHHLG